jgi:electron transport complex protein RnfA
VTELFLVFIAACLANNLVLDYLLGLSPVFSVSRKLETAIGMSLAMFIMLPVTSLFTYLLDLVFLTPYKLEVLQLVSFVLIVTLLTLTIDRILQKFRPELHERTSVFIPLLLVNTSLIGVALINIQQNHGIIASVFFAMGSDTGFGIVIVIFSALRERIVAADVPIAFQGISILLITLGILSMAFMGFTGIG